jgi:plastocyanin
MYFPPWVPVAFIILVVFGILGALFIVRSTAGHPLIGEDHWHASYQVIICGQRQPNFPAWGGGVHTHADGIIHIHPFRSAEEGSGARLVKWFEYGGGKLTEDEMRMPGTRETYKNGDKCDDGKEAVLQVFVNDQKLDDFTRFIPQDGDRVRIVFGPEEESGPIEQEDRTIIPEDEAARTFEMEITGAEGDAAFSPDNIEIVAGETVKIVVTNNGSISHSLRVAGADGEYETSDDFVATSGEDDSDIILPGEQGTVIVRFDDEGRYEFQDPTAPAAQGAITATAVQATPTPTPDEEVPDVDADVTLEVAMHDNFFEPADLEVEAGQTFLIKLTNNGEFVHNMRIAGPDNVFETDDDLVSEPASPDAGAGGTLFGSIDEPGTYDIRSDFQRGEMIGTITVK